MEATVEKGATGGWTVMLGEDVYWVATNAEAWRLADQLNGEPHNAKESRHEWGFRRWINGE